MTKTCSCGAVYEMDVWELLMLVGYQADPPLKLELRNCGLCKTTLAVLVDGRGNYVEAHPYDEAWGCPESTIKKAAANGILDQHLVDSIG